MSKSKIYTKTGDKGETGLVSGTRTSKADPRIDLYGEVDELNSRVGHALSFMSDSSKFSSTKKTLTIIQNLLFDLGSNLACEQKKRKEYKLPQIQDEDVHLLENQIDLMDGKLSPLKNFILPQGSSVTTSIHLCRTNARKVERLMIGFSKNTGESLPDNSLVFMNRLSDYFFVLARYTNHLLEIQETVWKSKK